MPVLKYVVSRLILCWSMTILKTSRRLRHCLSDKIGHYKLEHDKFLSNSEVKCVANKLPTIKNIEMKEHIVKNEYDNQELLVIMKDKNIFVKGLLPGVGKTYPIRIPIQ